MKKKNAVKILILTGLLMLFVSGCGKDSSMEVTNGHIDVDTQALNVSAQGSEDISQEISMEIVKPAEETDEVLADNGLLEEGLTDDDTEEVSEDALEDEAVEEVSYVEVTPGAVEPVALNGVWQYANYSKIGSGTAALYRAASGRKNVVIGVNAGHGTKGGTSVKTYCHPDMTPKVTGGTTASGSITAAAVSGGMSFADGAREADVTLRMAQILRDKLLAKGYDVLMLRDGPDVQLDNIARTVIANNTANCLISLHWDGDGLAYDKGCFYISTPDGIKNMEPVASHWQMHEQLGQALIAGLGGAGCKINGGGKMAIDLTQTCYSTIPSIDIELGNQASAHDDVTLSKLADGLVAGIGMLY
ncbi:MAG: N-acetylmuramoyl-L-alanine amidase [Lachnospiraceae bacterium]|nr:N-acetylmuramoyl-L-alanine amidase [Lachnospiraceae bacterium]